MHVQVDDVHVQLQVDDVHVLRCLFVFFRVHRYRLSACSNQNSAEKSAVEVWPDTADTLFFEPVCSSLVKVVDGFVVHVWRILGGVTRIPDVFETGTRGPEALGRHRNRFLIIC